MKPNKSQIADVPPAKQKCKARIQPHAILGVAVSCLAAGAFVAYAATGGNFSFPKSSYKAAVPMKNRSASPVSSEANNGAKAQLLGDTRGAKKGGFLLTQADGGGVISPANIVGPGRSGNNLSELDLTPNTESDERDASFSPNGQYIAFRSNGVDTDKDGKLDATGFSAGKRYHLWVGKLTVTNGATSLSVYQVTGQSSLFLEGYDQYRPVWSTNSRELAFVSNSAINSGANSGEQIYRINLNLQNDGTPQPDQPYKLTNFAGAKKSPAWSLNGTELVFAAKSSVLGGTGTSYDLFRISSNGQSTLFTRVTGGTATDAAGAAANVDDINPAFSLTQQNVVYFSSNRTTGSGRRIYVVRTDGTGLQLVTDPTKRQYGKATDNDDFPALSLAGGDGGSGEVLAFQTNSLIDSSDATRDRNIWALPVDSLSIGSAPTDPSARIFISAFNGGEVSFYNPPEGTTAATKYNVESGANIIPSPEGLVYYQNNVYISSRSANRIERLDAATGAPSPAAGRIGTAFTPTDAPGVTTPTGIEVPSPSGLAIYGGNLYVASGGDTKTAVYRYSAFSGAPNGKFIPGTDTVDGYASAEFTFGEPTDKPLGDAGNTISEGVAVSRDGTRLYVSNYAKNRVNIYTLVSFTAPIGGKFNEAGTESKDFIAGQWIGEITAPQATSTVDDPDGPLVNGARAKAELKAPTGVAIGPDINGDGIEDLYASSSTYNDVLAFALDDDGTPQKLANGDDFKFIVRDNQAGSFSRLVAPEGVRFTAGVVDNKGTTTTADDTTTYTMYVSAYGGNTFNRYTRTDTRTVQGDWVNAPLNPANAATSAAWITGIAGPAYFDFNTLFASNYIDINSGTSTGGGFVGETTSSSYVVTNILSSPANFAASDLNRVTYDSSGKPLQVNVTEDKSADIEASFGRDDAANPALLSRTRIVFSSNRKFAAVPASNGVGATASNPSGGFDVITGIGDPSTNCDLWITASADLNAPVIQPEQNNYPMLSPTHVNSSVDPDTGVSNPDIGPRTKRGGLTPGGVLKLALMAKEQESGLSQVSFAFSNAEDIRRFQQDGPGGRINDAKIGLVQREKSPADWPKVTGFNFDDAAMSVNLVNQTTGALNTPVTGNYFSDQGPRGTYPERQSNAVAGDGIYYIAKQIKTPTTAGDYYISVRMRDREGNFSYYYFIWGFSTQDFSPSTSNDIFVSDNTAGQQVIINNLGGSARTRFKAPVESFYLSNWGGNVAPNIGYTAGSIGELVNGEYSAKAQSNAVTLSAVDVWRVLCRGPIDEDIVSTNYIPSTVTQINPDKFGDDYNGFTIKDKVFANVQRAVLWAAPYAGTAEVEFDIPGSIKEGATKQQLKRLLAGGGRLFLTGRNVLTALDEGGADNSFRSEELYATATGKQFLGAPYQTALAVNTGTGAFPVIGIDGADYSDLQFGWTHNDPTTQDDYRDSSYSHDLIPGDAYTPGTGTGVTINQAYSASGNPFGQRITKKRNPSDLNSGLESRVVFFPFNFDGVNRRYNGNSFLALNARAEIANGIRTWFKTGTYSGTVVDNTGAVVSNGLVAIQGGTDIYYARTDATGFYEVKGLPAGRGYTAFFVFNDKTFDGTPDGVDGDKNDRDDLPVDDVNRNYFSGTTVLGRVMPAGGTLAGNEIRVEKVSPTSITGKVYTYAGSGATDNPLDRTLHTPIGGIQVLLTVVPTVPASKLPVYTRLSKTSATGEFTFADAPPGRDLLLILNPKPTDVPEGSDIVNPNDPTNTTITYNKEYGRRVIPIAGDKRRTGDINGTQNDVFVVNDTYTFDATKTSLSEYVDPPTDTAADEKDAKGISLPVVLTRGEPISGKFTLQAGNDALRVGAGWVVKLISTDTPPRTTRQVVTKADGTFTFDEVIFGKYKLEGTVDPAVVNGYDKLTVTSAEIDTDTLTDATRLTQNLTAKISHLQGYVKVNGAYVSGATVSLKNLNGTTVEFGGIKREGKTGNVANNANYFIPFVPDGTYNVVATLADGVTTKTEKNVVFNSTGNSPNLSIVKNFDFEISQLEVSVSALYAGLSNDAVTVKLFKTATPTVAYKTLTTDANGKVTFIGIDPGTYNITATKTLNGVTATTTLSNKTVSGATTSATLVLKWDSLKGVVKLDGTVQEGARIQFFLGSTELTALEMTTDASGAFEAGKTGNATLATPLAPGNYRVRASLVVGGLTLSQEKTVTLSASPLGQVVSVGDFNFVPAYLTGKVLLNGSAASGFNVVLYNSNNTLFKDDGGVGRSAVTNASGSYRMDYVPAGTNNFIVKATKVFNTITAAGQVTVPTVNASGETKAGNINITIADGLRGQVTVNGVGTAGARLQVLLKKVPVGSPVVTDASGNYFIAGLADGSYKLNADYTEGGFALKTLSKSFTVKKGVYKANLINFAFKVTRLIGNVTVNGKSVAGVGVTLLDSKGKALKTPVSATTDANGKYVMSGVKAATYQIKATFGTSVNTVTQKVGNLATTVAPTIALTRQELEATTVIKVGANGSTRALPRATVEILSSTGNSLGTSYTATSDANGKASFYGLANGSYRARVSAQGVTTTTVFSVGTGFTARTFPITLSQAGSLLALSESNNLRTTELDGIDILYVSLLVKPTANVVVTFTANTPAEAIFSAGTAATLTFTPTNWNVGQTVTFVGQQDNQDDGNEPFTVTGTVASTDSLFSAISTFTLSGINYEVAAAPTTGPTFAANTKTLVSTPFTAVDGTLAVSSVFGTSGYTLYRFNAQSQKAQFTTSAGTFPGSDWIAISGSTKMERGRGYLLVTGSSPVTMLIPASPTVFSGDTFAVDVYRNPNYKAQTGAASDLNNGYDLVGFPFDPTTIEGFNIFESQVLAEGILYGSYAEAAGAGKVSNRIYTVDSLGRPKELAPGDSTIRPYRGYFVKIFVDSAKIIMKANPSNGSSGSGSGTSAAKTSAKSS